MDSPHLASSRTRYYKLALGDSFSSQETNITRKRSASVNRGQPKNCPFYPFNSGSAAKPTKRGNTTNPFDRKDHKSQNGPARSQKQPNAVPLHAFHTGHIK